MNSSLTYGQLYESLRGLDFSEHAVKIEGKQRRLFEHKTIANAMIVLPDREKSDEVEPFFLRSVSALLQGNKLLDDESQLIASLRNGTAGADSAKA